MGQGGQEFALLLFKVRILLIRSTAWFFLVQTFAMRWIILLSFVPVVLCTDRCFVTNDANLTALPKEGLQTVDNQVCIDIFFLQISLGTSVVQW